MFGLSELSIKRLAKTHGWRLRRVTPFATPGARALVKTPVGAPVRLKRTTRKGKSEDLIPELN
jgi:hypothetical protein